MLRIVLFGCVGVVVLVLVGGTVIKFLPETAIPDEMLEAIHSFPSFSALTKSNILGLIAGAAGVTAMALFFAVLKFFGVDTSI